MRVIITAVIKNNPYHGFPYMNGVLWNIQGDSQDLKNLQSELEVIKQKLNREANRHGLKYSDLKVTIEFLR